MIKDIEPSQLKEIVDNNSTVLVHFYLEGSMPCTLLDEIFKAIDREYGKKLVIVRIDHKKYYDECIKMKAIITPTIVVFKDGMMLEKEMSYKTKDELMYMLKKYLV